MNNIEIIEESKDRKIRRHEVNFSAIQGNQSQDVIWKSLLIIFLVISMHGMVKRIYLKC